MAEPLHGGTEEVRSDEATGVLGWVLFALLIGYTYLIHQGIGPDTGRNSSWYTPNSFLFEAPVISEMFETVLDAIALFGVPALLLAVAVFLTNRSAIARAIAISCVLTVCVYVFYGVEADSIWTFFHWRASAVLPLMCCAIGFALAAPFLAQSWLRLAWPLRIVAYLPFLFGVLAFVRNATGSDQSLQFAISPWPAVSVFGIELGALLVMVVMIGIAFGLGGLASARTQTGSHALRSSLVGVALGLLVPALLLWLGDWLRMFPFRLGVPMIAGMAVACAIAIAIGATLGVRKNPDVLRYRAHGLAVGAALLALPLLSGQALARYDYYVAREVYARQITDALAVYLEREELYPDELEHLVEAGDLSEIPEPSIGFGFLYDDPFRYRSFGTSFILEFPAPRWVECAYTPPFEDEDGEEYDENEFGVGGYDNPGIPDDADSDVNEDEDSADAAAGEGSADDAEQDEEVEESSLDEAWSCPSTPPELW
jgi:hypothetical protein